MKAKTNTGWKIGLAVLATATFLRAAQASGSLSPSGIVVYSESQNDSRPLAQSKPPQLYLLRLGQSKAVPLIDAGNARLIQNDFQETTFDSSGTFVAFLSYKRTSRRADNERSLWVLNIKSRAMAAVADGVDSYEWSPVAPQLLFHASTAKTDQYLSYDALTNRTRQLFPSGARVGEVAWANAGKAIAFQENNRSIKEMEIRTSRITTRWKSLKDVGVDIFPSPYDNSLIVCTYLENYCYWRNRTKPWTFETGNLVPPGIVWSPDARDIAIHYFSYYPLSEGNSILPVGTDQYIYVLDSRTSKTSLDGIECTDGVAGPYRYQIVGWTGEHASLLLLDRGIYTGPDPKSESIFSLNMQTHAKTELIRINAAIGSIAWHGFNR